MTLDQIISDLRLTTLTPPKDFSSVTPSGGYTSDMLSCVMSGAGKHNLWITLQAHVNIVAVAALLDLAAVIITEGAQPDEATLAKAEEKGVTLLGSDQSSFEIVGRLWELGLRGG